MRHSGLTLASGIIHQLAMPARCSTAGRSSKRACLGLPDAIALE